MAYGGNIGDPWNNWQPNNPFLEMLAAIDGRKAQQVDKMVEIITDTQATSSSRISGPRHQAFGLQGRSCASRCQE